MLNRTVREVQCNRIIGCLEHMRTGGLTRIEPTVTAEATWHTVVDELVLPLVRETGSIPGRGAWNMGSNIPGKPVGSLNFTGGTSCARRKERNV
ncbi:hypothetical protein C8J56DRAFT_981882, partial [Mycena floridula]